MIGDTLISSEYSGNQWFLNGQPILGATDVKYIPTLAGFYSVQTNQFGCASPMSDSINFVITALNDPVLNEKILVYPNPANDQIFIKNNYRRLIQMELKDIHGRSVYVSRSVADVTVISLKNISAGFYIVVITDPVRKVYTTKTFIRQ